MVTRRAVEELRRARLTGGSVLTLGTFDGVHVGHRRLVEAVVGEATRRGLHSVVLTFNVPPRAILYPETRVLQLSSLSERLALLRELGVDAVVPLTFDRDLASLSAREFVTLLVENLRVRHLVTGPDFALGHNREGDVAALTALGEELDYTVQVIQPLLDDGGRVSSTSIREALRAGDIERTNRFLGRPFLLSGTVARGHARGKGLGFPTANVAISPERAVPADGVYATRLLLRGESFPSVTNVGDNPTFGDAERSVEVHVLDFDRDIYGAEVGIEFVQRLRGEVKFSTVDALLDQIREDVERARAILGCSA
ncbi:MAG: bifunctional riboflavin kinase/FAD synthetase [Chloroflexi bacterium]|nr:bifunctional riboflavin kinase/FAD synthetase [Chloroflexota bacterium]